MHSPPPLGILPTAVWLVDDDAELRESVEQTLSAADTSLRITGSFGSPSDVLSALALGEVPSVALVDLGLPEPGGHALIRELHQRKPSVALLAFTVRADDDAVFSALRAGARGYITKDASVAELVRAVQDAVRGGAPLSRDISLRVVSRFWQTSKRSANTVDTLTVREREVLEALCTGASYREAGRWLGLSEGTIQTHIKRIYEKLGVCSKAEAVRVACEAGLTSR
jgi:two-component system nitrate/nitrite response regulator NarL